MTAFNLHFNFERSEFNQIPVQLQHLRKIEQLMQNFLPFSFPLKGTIYVNIVSNLTMTKLLKNYYPFKKTTDVLSFPHTTNLMTNTASTIIGEIYLSFFQSKLQAQQFGHSWLRESCYLLVHGILHLLGYDHCNKNEQQIMRYWEEFFVTQKLAIIQ